MFGILQYFESTCSAFHDVIAQTTQCLLCPVLLFRLRVANSSILRLMLSFPYGIVNTITKITLIYTWCHAGFVTLLQVVSFEGTSLIVYE